MTSALYNVTTTVMTLLQACADYLDLAQTQGRRWQKMLQYEHEQRLRLEEMVEQLAKQHSSFEKLARKSLAAVVNADQSKGTYNCNLVIKNLDTNSDLLIQYFLSFE